MALLMGLRRTRSPIDSCATWTTQPACCGSNAPRPARAPAARGARGATAAAGRAGGGRDPDAPLFGDHDRHWVGCALSANRVRSPIVGGRRWCVWQPRGCRNPRCVGRPNEQGMHRPSRDRSSQRGCAHRPMVASRAQTPARGAPARVRFLGTQNQHGQSGGVFQGRRSNR